MAVPDTLARSGGSFPNVARLGRLGPEAAAQLDRACAKLRAAGAMVSAERIASLDNEAGRRTSYSTLEMLADPQRAEDELATVTERPVRWTHTLRNFFALLPLLLTWIMLGLASRAYLQDLHAHPSQSNQPFLLLWAQGFDTGFPSFAEVAFIDFGLLLGVLALTAWAHQAEGKAARTAIDVTDALYSALGMLEVAVEQSVVRAPASAEEWAAAASRIIADAIQETKLLAETSREATELAAERLTGLQDQGRDFIQQFSAEIAQTLVAVRKDNEQFINRTASETREVLRHLVQQQMEPLIQQLTGMLAEFGRHQDVYRVAATDLTQGATGVRDAARELVDSAQAYNKVADSVSKNLTAIESSQRDFTAQVTGSADSMASAAQAMKEFHGTLRDMHESVQQMAANVTAASGALEAVQHKLADTSTALTDSSAALSRATRDLRGTTRGYYGSTRGRRLWWPFGRR